MNRSMLRFGLAAGALAAIAIPATVIAGSGTQQDSIPSYMSTDVTGVNTTSGAGWQPVTNLVSLGTTGSIASVSADLSKGRAKFRVKTLASNNVGIPDSVTFASPGASSYDFVVAGDCEYVGVEWKRVGDEPAVMKNATLHVISEAACG